MTCRELNAFMLDFATGELDPAIRARFERHLASCTNCCEYLRQYQQTVHAGQRAFACEEERLPAGIPDDLVAAILDARKNS